MGRNLAERTSARLVALVVLLVVLLAAQFGATSIAPTGRSARTGPLIGRASFAYLSGIRTFAAAVLWNRLEPQFDLYYSDRPLSQQVELLPTIRVVQMLDPQFVQAYYIASWVVSRNGDFEEGFRVSREGIRANPRSGLLRSSYIQNMMLHDNERKARGEAPIHTREEIAQADAAMRPDTMWSNNAEKVEGYAVVATAYELAGLVQKADAARALADAARASSAP